MPVTLRLRHMQLAKLRKLAKIDTDQELARVMGVNPATVSRVLQGKQAPGPKFMASLVQVFDGWDLDDLFEVVEMEDHAA